MKNSKPLVSVIMNSHNGEKFIKRSITSVLKQSYTRWELIFWDNCSQDNSKKIIKKFNDRRIKYFYSNKFFTLYKSRNLAIKKAKGKYLCFLDVDDQWKYMKLKEQVRSLEQLNLKFIYSNYLIKNKMKNKIYLRKKGELPQGFITQRLLDDYFIGIITVMIRKDVFKSFKFNSGYNVIGDFDLFIKLSLKYKFASSQKAFAIYNIHGKNMSLTKLKIYTQELEYWIKKNEKNLLKNLNVNKIKILLFKLKIKNFFKNIF